MDMYQSHSVHISQRASFSILFTGRKAGQADTGIIHPFPGAVSIQIQSLWDNVSLTWKSFAGAHPLHLSCSEHSSFLPDTCSIPKCLAVFDRPVWTKNKNPGTRLMKNKSQATGQMFCVTWNDGMVFEAPLSYHLKAVDKPKGKFHHFDQMSPPSNQC